MFRESMKKTALTSCQCTLKRVTANSLLKHLGDPKYDDAELGIDREDNPTSMQWVFEDDAENIVTIYDWRGTAAFQRDKPMTWSIGARNLSEAVRFRNWLMGKMHPLAKNTDPWNGEIFNKVPPGF
tara:strand:- start:926 stop:1303 length:378 start_codon:yes stop_codon:yes gene_type:complete